MEIHILLISFAAIILGIPATVVCIFATCIIIQRRKYSHIPTPPLLGFFSGHASEIEKRKHHGPAFDSFVLKWAIELKSDIICIWFYHMPFITVTGTENVKELLINKGYSKSKETFESLANPFGERYMGNSLVVVADYETWKPKRQLFNPAFHRAYLKDLVPIFNHASDLLIGKLRKVADGKTELKMYEEFSKCTLNIIANAGCGLDVDLINNKLELGDYVPRVMEGMEYLVFHPLYWLNPLAWKYAEEIRETVRKLRKIGRDVILKRRKELAEGKDLEKDLLSFIVKAADKDASLSVEDLVDEYSTFFVAGHETTGSLLGITLLIIANHPIVEQKLLEEIEEVLGNKKSADVEDLPKLNYMGQVFKEVLRLWPIASATVRTVCKDQIISGYRLPKDTNVVVSFYVNGRHPDYWTDPDAFNPDRFAEGCKYEPIMYTPFSAGPRNCIGQHMAQMEAKVLLSRFLQEFKFKLSPEQDMDVHESGTLKPKAGTRGTLVVRKKDD